MRTRLAVFGCAAAMVLTACGGTSPGDLIEAAGGARGADVEIEDLLSEAGLDDDDGISASVGGAEINFGGNDRPDWLPVEFLWPDNFQAQYAINDESTGERAYLGSVEGADLDAFRSDQYGRLGAAGYERLGDTGIFIAPDGQAIEVELQQGPNMVQVRVSDRGEDEQTLRDAYAPIEGEGTMAVQLGDDNYLFTGTCSLRSSSGHFAAIDSEPGDDSGEMTIDIRDGEQNYILGNVITLSDDSVTVWSMIQVDEAGNFPTIMMTGTGFTVDGFMGDFSGGPTTPVAIEVTCPA